MELLKQYLGSLVPCIPGEVAKNMEFRWLASVKSKQHAYMRRTLGEREPASCHLGSLPPQNSKHRQKQVSSGPPPTIPVILLLEVTYFWKPASFQSTHSGGV